jgi:hypothetical protein
MCKVLAVQGRAGQQTAGWCMANQGLCFMFYIFNVTKKCDDEELMFCGVLKTTKSIHLPHPLFSK